jgi:F-type H+-transporting ATPase subunit b
MQVRRFVWFVVLALVCVGAGSAAAASVADEAGPWTVGKLIWRVINTLGLVVLLVYFLKKPLVTFFSERTAGIKQDIADAREMLLKAEATIKEYEAKIAGMEKELERMRGELRKAADAESEKVVANAERMSKGVVEAARLAGEQEVRKAKTELQNEAVTLAVKLAEALIRDKINEQDHQRLVQEYLAKVEGMK